MILITIGTIILVIVVVYYAKNNPYAKLRSFKKNDDVESIASLLNSTNNKNINFLNQIILVLSNYTTVNRRFLPRPALYGLEQFAKMNNDYVFSREAVEKITYALYTYTDEAINTLSAIGESAVEPLALQMNNDGRDKTDNGPIATYAIQAFTQMYFRNNDPHLRVIILNKIASFFNTNFVARSGGNSDFLNSCIKHSILNFYNKIKINDEQVFNNIRLYILNSNCWKDNEARYGYINIFEHLKKHIVF